MIFHNLLQLLLNFRKLMIQIQSLNGNLISAHLIYIVRDKLLIRLYIEKHTRYLAAGSRKLCLLILYKGIPFELKLATQKPKALGAMTREELSAEIQASIDSMKAGRVHTADEVDEILKKEFGI